MVVVNSPSEGPSTSTRSASTERGFLTSILPKFTTKGKFVRRRYKSSLKNANRKIEELQEKNTALIRNNKRIQKRIERLRANEFKERHVSSDGDLDTTDGTFSQPESPALTPRSKTKEFVDKLKLTKTGRRLLCKRILFAECIIQDLKQSMRSVNKKIVGKLPFYAAKKYKLMSELNRQTGVNRRIGKKKKEPDKRLIRKEKLEETITTFLTREDNSTVLVGKKKSDAVRINETEHQKRILNDYTHNLHEKFRLENPTVKVSRATFYNARPKYLLLANFASRRTCLCSRHQNIALKLKAMRALGVSVSKSPDTFIKENDTNEKVRETIEPKLPENVKFTSWKKVLENNKNRWKEIEETVSKNQFLEIIDNQTSDFRAHVKRVQNQYSEMRKLRENLPEKEIVLWMDFAENFMCTSVEAVQSSYWNQAMVSLHTMVAYFPQDGDQRLQSYVAVSDVLSHNATVVYTILQKLIPQLKIDYPDLSKIHYLTDSPTSQYRNKTIFKVLADHMDDFGVDARWNYLESGHGKGHCDILGASIKRGADMAIRQGKALIQNGEDFYAWAKQTEENGSKIKYLFYSQEEVDNAEKILHEKEKPLPISGTFRLHAVVPISKNLIMTRDMSCSCNECLTDVRSSPHSWKLHTLCKEGYGNDNNEQTDHQVIEEVIEEMETEEPPSNPDLEIKLSSWVSCAYEGNWYIGQLVTIDHDDPDNEFEVNFLRKSGNYGRLYKWPTPDRDEIWRARKNILTVLQQEPRQAGRTKRTSGTFEIDQNEIDNAEKIFSRYK